MRIRSAVARAAAIDGSALDVRSRELSRIYPRPRPLRRSSRSTACSSIWGSRRCNLTIRERGFSLGKSAPLDMRMDPAVGRSAYEVLDDRERERTRRHLLSLRRGACCAPHRARDRGAPRDGTLPKTTAEFAAARRRRSCSDPDAASAFIRRRASFRRCASPSTTSSTRLRDGLRGAVGRLRGAGRVVAISFHSLEDRIVKQTFRDDERLDVLTKRPFCPEPTRLPRTGARAAPSCAPRNGRPADVLAPQHLRTAVRIYAIRAPSAPRRSGASSASRARVTPAYRAFSRC